MRVRVGGRHAGRAYGWLGPVLSALVLLIGLAAAYLAYSGLRASERDAARRAMDQRTAVARTAVVAETARYLELLRTAAAGAGTTDRVTGHGFRAATLPFTRAGLTGVSSVVFAVPASGPEVAETQRTWRANGSTGLTLMPQPVAREHFFTIFSRPLDGGRAAPLGVDIAASPEAVAALAESRRTGMPAVSDAYVLLVDRTQPQARQQFSFLLAASVFGVRPDGRQGEFRGWLMMGLRGQDFLTGVLGDTGQGLLGGELNVTNADGRRLVVARYPTRGEADVSRQATFPVGNRQWTLTTGADSSRLPVGSGPLPDIVLVGGALGSVLLAGLVWVLATARARAQARVQVATAEVREAEAEARRQAGLLAAIMASIGDGVGVIDSEGRFLLHNPAAKQLLGISDDRDGPDGWQEYYGLFRTDGTTPYPLEELPLVRGLRGESVNGVEMVVRNAHRPEGLLISVDGRPLDPSAGQNGAVAVFHDITELRRYEHDLSIFAGVAAHDLKAPLAVVRGHCELAGAALGDVGASSPQVAEARDALRRIAGAVDRMAALIDTLLAYTTARDAPLRLTDLPLGPLVADVIAERTGHLRAGVDPIPDIYVGPLPAAVADPAMLRHVIDNLIGNALKYVQHGRQPRIDVTTGPAAPGRVRLDVADRGIGIPDEDKPQVFDSFHRAHSGAGYAGTGLGLAICKRIVERHGGAIAVADNPGGGTRFEVTLRAPEAPDPQPPAPPPAAALIPTAAAAP